MRQLIVGLMMLGTVATSTTAFANNITVDVALTGGTTFFGATHTDNLDFTDTFTFTGLGSLMTNASLITIGVGFNNIDFISADINGFALTLSPNGYFETGLLSDTLLTAPLVLTVIGKSGAAGGIFASYSGTLNVTPLSVPEPASGLLLGAGIAGIGIFRRKSA